MDEFLCSLANYTEKVNPYHSIDAYPGTEFSETEAILKLFYPLIAFQFENGLRIILTNGLIKEVFGKLDFRYYLNYMILPSIEKYRNSLPKLSDMENDFNTVVGYSKGYANICANTRPSIALVASSSSGPIVGNNSGFCANSDTRAFPLF